MPRLHLTYAPGGYDAQRADGNVLATDTLPDDPAPGSVLADRLTQTLGTLRSIAQQADAASQQTGALTLAQVTTQLRQTQAGLAAVTLAALRLARLVAGQLDGID